MDRLQVRSWIPVSLITLAGLVGALIVFDEVVALRTDPPMIALEFPLSGDGAREVLRRWEDRGQLGQARQAIEVHYWFIAAYVTLGLGLVLSVRRLIERRKRWWALLAVPPVAGFFDGLGSQGRVDLLDGDFAGHVPVLVTGFAAIKFVLLALGLFAVARVGLPYLRKTFRENWWLASLIAATAWSGTAGFWYLDLDRAALVQLVVAVLCTLAFLLEALIGTHSTSRTPVSFKSVMNAELRQIRQVRPRRRSRGAERKADAVATEAAPLEDLAGLALSGGGVRSATFNLGLLQALSRMRLLSKIDYLSTVSGGGYIGSWLMQWVRREAHEQGDDAAAAARAIREVEAELGGSASAAHTEPLAVKHLRNYSNYLTPQVGLLTADTWTTVATYLRNFLLNLILIGALGSLVILLPRGLAWGMNAIGSLNVRAWLYLAIALAGIAVLNIARNLRLAALGLESEKPALTSQGGIQRWVVAPLVLSSILASRWFGTADGLEWGRWDWALATSVAYALPWLLFGWATSVRRLRGEDAAARAEETEEESSWVPDAARKLANKIGDSARDFLKPPEEVFGKRARPWVSANAAMALVGLPVGGVCGLLLYALKRWASGTDSWTLLTVGAPSLMLLFTLSAVLLIGLAGVHLEDYLREWLARAGAWVLIYSLGWTAFIGLAVYGPVVVAAVGPFGRGVVSSGWLLTSVAGALAGNAQQQGSSRRWHGPVLKLAPWVFVIGLVLVLAWGLDAGLSRSDDPLDGGDCPSVAHCWERVSAAAHLSEVTESVSYETGGETVRVERRSKLSRSWLRELDDAHKDLLSAQVRHGEFGWWLLVMAVVAVALSLRVDINEFSMHNYYRNRLVRAFLGASNPRRRKGAQQPFTGMDPEDDGKLGIGRPLRPFHIVNTCLNIVGGKRLAWQQRKAASLSLTPLHTGYELPESELGEVRSAFRSSDELEGMSLGTAMAISGAAASPNMGFRSSPALALLLTVFNVRLGWWLGNPHGECFSQPSPRFALKPLLAELFGQTSYDAPHVYLSDGGHFENLGLYELVRRRCRYIIVSDVGADPDLAFEDLGNAIRKCRNDFGAEIDIDVETLKAEDGGASRRHCVVGRLTYLPEEKPGRRRERTGDTGWLLYIKATLTGDEQEDIAQYAADHPTFPHQSTGDQFFDESQFESYRKLGEHVGERVFRSASNLLGPRFSNWERLFSDLRQRWYAPSAAIEKSFSRHGDALARLFRQLRENRRLRFLDGQFYGELDSVVGAPSSGLPTRSDQWIAGFYFCNSMIQLMENVYLDLKLDEESGHPDNRGWMHLFGRWARAPMFRATWAASAVTFGSRFQTFGERQLGLDFGEIVSARPENEAREALEKAMARGLSNILEPGVSAKKVMEQLPAEVELLELSVDAQGLSFPIGLCALVPAAEGGRGRRLLYFEIRSSLRQCGLAQRALRFLARRHRVRLATEAERIPEIEEHHWKRFRHFFEGAVGR